MLETIALHPTTLPRIAYVDDARAPRWHTRPKALSHVDRDVERRLAGAIATVLHGNMQPMAHEGLEGRRGPIGGEADGTAEYVDASGTGDLLAEGGDVGKRHEGFSTNERRLVRGECKATAKLVRQQREAVHSQAAGGMAIEGALGMGDAACMLHQSPVMTVPPAGGRQDV